MSYQALVFCPEEKTARTVTQVLTELDFTVETCTEPFAAVKKLMGQHFDAIVVDCDNEQNATLLFKSARNSSSNQTALAVAVVEGQAGVAKAFRIGANLVLTKPINMEQAKGTVRVARGLLRKSDPGKSVNAAPTAPTAPAATPAKPAAPRPVATAKPAAPTSPKPLSKPIAVQSPSLKPVAPPAWPIAPATISAPAASSAPAAKDDDLLEIDLEEPIRPAASPAIPSTTSHSEKLPEPQSAPKPAFAAAITITGSGAASAPAPARISETPAKAPEDKASGAAVEQPSTPAHGEPSAVVGATPSFSFGGASTEPSSGGGSKKILLGVAAAVVFTAAAYFGWTQFQGHSSQPSATQAPVTAAPVAKPQTAKPVPAQPSPVITSAPGKPETVLPTQDITLSTAPTTNSTDEIEASPKSAATHSAGNSAKLSPATAAKSEAEPAPLMVKGGKVPAAQSKASATDAPAPSLIGLAAPGASALPQNLVPTTSNAFKPTLQTVNISQGVSQGLLIKKVSPSYPSNALRMRIEGGVQLLATVSRDGNITQVKILSGDAQLTRAAVDAVKQWKYKPYLLNGEPVEIQTQVTINFKLPR
ncbi:MAG: TonB family protein [Candidatus Sulfotelmatobacter sp.]